MSSALDVFFVLAASAFVVTALVRALQMAGALWGKDD